MTRKKPFALPVSAALLAVLSAALLQACGGGHDHRDGNPATPGPTAPASTNNTGSVTAPFNRGIASRYQLTSGVSQSFGVLTASMQDASGAMTMIDTTVLSGAATVKEIAGDATFAMGRWVAGTVTTTSGATTLTGTDNRAYHYIAVNSPSVFPSAGTLNCGAGSFTTPTYASGGSPGTTGVATGSATLSFGASGATIGGAIHVTASGTSGMASLSGFIVTPNSSATTGAFFSNGGGAYSQIGDAGSGAYLVATSFAVTLANGARYIGVAKFRCS